MKYFLLIGCVFLTACGDVSEPSIQTVFTLPEEPAHVYRLNTETDVIPEAAAGVVTRAADGATLLFEAGQRIDRLQSGVYGRERLLVYIRTGNDSAAHALSCSGIAQEPYADKEHLIEWAEQGIALTPESLVISAWRQGDRFPWPWVDNPAFHDGLASLCKRVNPTAKGYNWDQSTGVYVDETGAPIGIGTEGRVVLGDLVAGVEQKLRREAEAGIFGILVADRGVLGALDPEDEVVSACPVPGMPTRQVRVWTLGSLIGPVPVHCFKRSRERAERILRSRYKPDNPIWRLSFKRQMMALAGMVLLIIVLFRHGRKMKQKQRRKS